MRFLKKTAGMCSIGFGLGALLVLFLPVSGWIFGIGIVTILIGLLCVYK